MLLCTFWILLIVSTAIGTVWNATKTEATPLGGVPWFSACSFGSPRYRGKVRGQKGTDSFTPKSAPLGHKSGMAHREIKINTYVTSTHFPCFLQNWSNCKTVLIETFQLASISRLLKDTVAISVSQKKIRCVFLKFWGSNLSQLFKIHFKGVVLKLLAPICKREKSGIHRCGFFPPEASLLL